MEFRTNTRALSERILGRGLELNAGKAYKTNIGRDKLLMIMPSLESQTISGLRDELDREKDDEVNIKRIEYSLDNLDTILNQISSDSWSEVELEYLLRNALEHNVPKHSSDIKAVLEEKRSVIQRKSISLIQDMLDNIDTNVLVIKGVSLEERLNAIDYKKIRPYGLMSMLIGMFHEDPVDFEIKRQGGLVIIWAKSNGRYFCITSIMMYIGLSITIDAATFISKYDIPENISLNRIVVSEYSSEKEFTLDKDKAPLVFDDIFSEYSSVPYSQIETSHIRIMLENLRQEENVINLIKGEPIEYLNNK